MGGALMPRNTVSGSIEESIGAMNEINARLATVRERLLGPRPENAQGQLSRPDGSITDRTQTLKDSVLSVMQKIGEIESAL